MTPVVILSSLAPGVDTLVVEGVLAYAKERGADIVVRCPLPFPAEIYERASSFNMEGRKARYREVLEKLMAEPWFDAGRDLFEVALDNDLMPPGATAEGDLQADDAEYGKPRRHLRYRAAGEYVATHSDLLLAVYDVPFDTPNVNLADRFESGSSTIVESKRAGLSHELLAVSNNFAWADNGPVLKRLLGMIFLAALSLGSFEHWHNHRVVHEPHAGQLSSVTRKANSLAPFRSWVF